MSIKCHAGDVWTTKIGLFIDEIRFQLKMTAPTFFLHIYPAQDKKCLSKEGAPNRTIDELLIH